MNRYSLSHHAARVIPLPGLPGTVNRNQTDASQGNLRRSRLKPAWGVLYAVAALTMLLFLVADVEVPAGAWRTLTECLSTALIIGVMALWVQANRAALALANAAQDTRWDREDSVTRFSRQQSEPGCDSDVVEFRQKSRAQAGPAEEENAKWIAK